MVARVFEQVSSKGPVKRGIRRSSPETTAAARQPVVARVFKQVSCERTCW